MQPDLGAASAFLDALCDDDDDGWCLTFQTFDDRPKRPRKSFAKVMQGAIGDHAKQLAALNESGAGVYVCINATDGQGRAAANIVGVRALFVDLDGSPLEPVLNGPLPPSCVVATSEGRWHAYWWAKGIQPELFGTWQKVLQKRFGGDAVHDICRVLRLPGFDNRKRKEPWRVQVVEADGARYTPIQLAEAFSLPLHPQPTTPRQAPAQRRGSGEKTSKYGAAAARNLAERLATCKQRGEARHTTLYSCAASLGSLVAGGELAEGDAIDALTDACKANGLLDERPDDVARTMGDGLREGAKTPRRASRGDTPPPHNDQDAPPHTQPQPPSAGDGQPPLISNYRAVENIGEDGEVTVTNVEMSLRELVDATHKAAGRWPRTVNGILFVADQPPAGRLPERDAIQMVNHPDPLFAWLRLQHDVRWTNREIFGSTPGKRTPITRGEYLCGLRAMAPRNYDALEMLPHHPMRATAFYACSGLPRGDGATLGAFTSLFNPDTPQDQDLLTAALLTPGWGGAPGTRPGFLLSSEHGVGAGKTQTAQLIAQVWGGALWINPRDDWEVVRQRMLSDSGLRKRCVIVDNIRDTVARGEIEAAITANTIDGKRLYHGGDFSRPNVITWLLTANTARFSRDLAQRCVIIHIGPPKHGVDFAAATRPFLEHPDMRFRLMCDIITALKEAKSGVIKPWHRDRFQAWQDGVLGVFDDPDELAEVIMHRRPEVDSDHGDAGDVRDALFRLMESRGHKIEEERVFITYAEAGSVLSGMLGVKTTRGLTRRLSGLAASQPLERFDVRYKHGKHGRGILYAGPAATTAIQQLRVTATRNWMDTDG